MDNLSEVTSGILTSAILAACVILMLLIFLYLYDRRQEIGIYLALGEKRTRIIFQILTEATLITFIGLTLSIGIGYVIADSMTQDMIETQLTSGNINPWKDTFLGNRSLTSG